MGRREAPLDPGSPLYEFAAGLRALRAEAGAPTYREMERRAGYSTSVLSAAASGASLPTLAVTLAFVGSCGGDAADWEQRWERLAELLRATNPGLLTARRPVPGANSANGPREHTAASARPPDPVSHLGTDLWRPLIRQVYQHLGSPPVHGFSREQVRLVLHGDRAADPALVNALLDACETTLGPRLAADEPAGQRARLRKALSAARLLAPPDSIPPQAPTGAHDARTTPRAGTAPDTQTQPAQDPPIPEGAADPGAFMARLRELRTWSQRSLRDFEQQAAQNGHWLPRASLSDALRRDTLPKPELLDAFLAACGLPKRDRERWTRVHDQLRNGQHPAPTTPASTPPNARAEHPAPSPPKNAAPGPLVQPLHRGDPPRIGSLWTLGRLGAGAMGEVYLAATPGGRPTAVKIVREEVARDPLFRRRFAREMEAIRKIESPYTPALIDADTEADRPWMATEYVPGPSLSETIDSDGPLPEQTVLGLGAAIAQALETIHAAGLVHRDLKPSNILLSDHGVKLIDFGISRTIEGTSLTMTGAQVGTAGFMAPEQARGTAITPATDVFALGCVLAYAATGALPFGDGASAAVLYRVVHEEPDPEALACRNRTLRELILACLAKNPAERPDPWQILGACKISDSSHPAASAVPPAIAAQASARAREAARLAARARPSRRFRRMRIGLGPLVLMLTIVIASLFASHANNPTPSISPSTTTTSPTPSATSSHAGRASPTAQDSIPPTDTLTTNSHP